TSCSPRRQSTFTARYSSSRTPYAQAERENPWSTGCEVALAGFYSNGAPGVARVVTRPGQKTLVDIYGHKTTGALVLMVGKKDAKCLVSSALGHARVTSPEKWIARAAATDAYLCEHEGEATIGGVPAVAVCHRWTRLYWPFLVLNGRKYLRGFDVTPTGI